MRALMLSRLDDTHERSIAPVKRIMPCLYTALAEILAKMRTAT